MNNDDLLAEQLDIFDSMNKFPATLAKAIAEGKNDIERFENFLISLDCENEQDLVDAFSAQACRPASPGTGTNPDIAALNLQVSDESDHKFIAERVLATLVLSILANPSFESSAQKQSEAHIDYQKNRVVFPSFHIAVSLFETDEQKVGPRTKKQCARVCNFANEFLKKVEGHKTWQNLVQDNINAKKPFARILKTVGFFASAKVEGSEKESTVKLDPGKNSKIP